jgi:hypothetical protein
MPREGHFGTWFVRGLSTGLLKIFGAPRYIVTPYGRKKRLQRDGVEQEYFGRDGGGFNGEKICGALIAT